MAPVVLEGLRRLSENIKKRAGGGGQVIFLFYTPSLVLTPSSGFHPSCSYASQRIGKTK
jgi:hypothetical protein